MERISFFLLISILLLGCKEDELVLLEPEEMFIGRWEIERFRDSPTAPFRLAFRENGQGQMFVFDTVPSQRFLWAYQSDPDILIFADPTSEPFDSMWNNNGIFSTFIWFIDELSRNEIHVRRKVTEEENGIFETTWTEDKLIRVE